jgi:alpha-L-fucosidase
MQDKIFEAAHICPSTRSWRGKDEFEAFFHFNGHTFPTASGRWDGRPAAVFKSHPSIPGQWLCIARSAGVKLAISDASITMASALAEPQHGAQRQAQPYKHATATWCAISSRRAARLTVQVGLYLSPWDRTSRPTASDAYNEYFKAQLTNC